MADPNRWAKYASTGGAGNSSRWDKYVTAEPPDPVARGRFLDRARAAVSRVLPDINVPDLPRAAADLGRSVLEDVQALGRVRVASRDPRRMRPYERLRHERLTEIVGEPQERDIERAGRAAATAVFPVGIAAETGVATIINSIANDDSERDALVRGYEEGAFPAVIRALGKEQQLESFRTRHPRLAPALELLGYAVAGGAGEAIGRAGGRAAARGTHTLAGRASRAARQTEPPRAVPELAETPPEATRTDQTVSEPAQAEIAPQPASQAAPAPKTGTPTTVMFPGTGEKRAARYAWVELEDVIPSHDPRSFARQPEELYPAEVQGRAYHGKRGRQAREAVAEVARRWDNEIALDPTIDAGGGRPVVVRRGDRYVVVAGNNRRMSEELLTPEKAAAFEAAMEQTAARLGLEPPTGMGRPTLVRVLDDVAPDDIEELRRLNAASDAPKGKTKDVLSDAATRAAQLRSAPRSLAHLSQTMPADATLRQYLETKAGGGFVDELIADGVIGQAEKARYVNLSTGSVTQEGKTLLERLLYAAAVGDADVIERATDASLRKLEHALPAIVRSGTFGGYELGTTLREALDILAGARAAGSRSVAEFVGQGDLLGRSFREEAAALAEFVDGASKKDVTEAFRRYAQDAEAAIRGLEAEDIFGYVPPSRDQAFVRHFNLDDSQAVHALRAPGTRRWSKYVDAPAEQAAEQTDEVFALRKRRWGKYAQRSDSGAQPLSGATGQEPFGASRNLPRDVLTPDDYRKGAKQTPRTPFDTPDVLAARARKATYPRTWRNTLKHINTPERQALREELTHEYHTRTGRFAHLALPGGEAPARERRAWVVIGGPGAGKSSAVVNDVVAQHRALVIDTDDIKEALPEYDRGINAAGVHEESAEIAVHAYGDAASAGEDLVLPMVGKNAPKMWEILNDLRAHGYDVELHLVELPPEKSAARAVARFYETLRFVDPTYILDVGERPRRTYDIVKSHSAVSRYRHVSSDVPLGEPHRVIDEAGALHSRVRPGRSLRQRSEADAQDTAGPDDSTPLRAPPQSEAPLAPGYVHPLVADHLPDVKPLASGGKAPAPRRSKMIKEVVELLEVGLGHGRFRVKDALGIFKSREGTIRLRNAQDIQSFAHEVGHKLHQVVFGAEPLRASRLEPWRDELGTLARAINTDDLLEGEAEFWRRYLTNPEAARASAPKFYATVDAALERAAPQIKTGLEKFRERYELWRTAGPESRIDAMISTSDEPKHWSIRDPWQRFRTDVLDHYQPLEQLAKEVSKSRPDLSEIAARVPRLARLMSGASGQAEHFIEHGTLDFRTLKKTGKGLHEILEPVVEDLQAFRRYAVARRVLDYHNRGLESGIDPADAAYVVAKYRTDSTFGHAFDELSEYQDRLLDYLVDAGVLSAERAALIRTGSGDYVPLYRVRDGGRGGRGGPFGEVWSPVKRRKGGSAEIIDPLESIVKHTYLYTDLAARQQLYDALHRLGQQYGIGRWMRRVDPPSRPVALNLAELKKQLEPILGEEVFEELRRQHKLAMSRASGGMFELSGKELPTSPLEELLVVYRPGDYAGVPNVISVLEDGQRVWYEVPEEVYTALMGLDKEQVATWARWLAAPARTLRAGATLAPEFLARNPIRDQLTAFVQSEYGFKPGWDFGRGLFHMLNLTDTYWRWKAAGGGGARAGGRAPARHPAPAAQGQHDRPLGRRERREQPDRHAAHAVGGDGGRDADRRVRARARRRGRLQGRLAEGRGRSA